MTPRTMGRKGGRSRSTAKRAAARRNGKLGGRPRAVEVFAREVRALTERLAPRLPHIDPGDLRLIARQLLLPPERRAVFVKRQADGRTKKTGPIR